MVEADLPGGPHAAWRARRLVDSELNGRIPRTVLADVSLLVTELVANAVRHGGADSDAAALRLLLEGRPEGRLRVEVANPGPSGEIAPRPPDLLARRRARTAHRREGGEPLGRARGAADRRSGSRSTSSVG